MQWSVASGAQTYDLLRNTTTPPTTVVTTTTGTQTSYLTTPALAASTTYYWRVVAKAVTGGVTLTASGPIWSFTTVAADPDPPDTPTYLLPTDTATGVNPALVEFSWNAAANAVTYGLLLDTVNPPVATAVATTGATGATITGLIPGNVYYWRVIARSALGVEVPGAVWSFTTQAVTTGCPAGGGC